MDRNELFHHGVKGMKWGVRKTVLKESSNAAKEAANAAGNIAKKTTLSKATKKKLSKMSDQELRAKINRMNMEQQYANLNPSRVSRGAALAQTILDTAGSVLAIGGSAATIALSIYTIREKMGKG